MQKGEKGNIILATQYSIPYHLKNDFGKIIDALQHFLTPSRFQKMKDIALKRSRRVLVVFENTHHAHNVSAILRTMDIFGFLELIFLYDNPEIRFRITDAIDRGASQWLLPKKCNSSKQCISYLKEHGYKIALVSLPDFSRTAQHYRKEIPAFSSEQFESSEFKNLLQDHKIALVFGSELIGISPEWKEHVDFYVYVPMYGFTESLNVSVCAGILLHGLRTFWEKNQSLNKDSFLLTEAEQTLILEYWISRTCTNAYEYIAHRRSELLNWFEFVRAGKFFQPFEQKNC